jgi:tetratricopeptide (TPR) repeat protein
MPDYSNALASWERRREYYATIRLGEDVANQTEAISRQTRELAQQQLASSSEVVASQMRVAEGIDSLALGIEDVARGIEGLQSCFEWGISAVVWQIEQSRESLCSILEVLQEPLDVNARHRRRRAEKAYSQGWIDDAEEEFLASEALNKFDFAVHMSLGMIYLFYKVDKGKALAYFEKAAKYATPESAYHRSIALLHGALCHRDMGRLDEAHLLTSEAISLTPNLWEARYQHAAHCALLGQVRECIGHLDAAIRSGPGYCLKAETDESFTPVRAEVIDLICRLRDEAANETETVVGSCSQFVDGVNQELAKVTRRVPGFSPRGFDDTYRQIRELLARESYIDAFVALGESKALVRQVREYASEQLKAVRQRLEASESASRDELVRLKESRDARSGLSGGGLGIAGALCGMVLGFRGCMSIVETADGAPRDSIANCLDRVFKMWICAPAVWFGAIVLIGCGLAVVGRVLGAELSATDSEALQEAQKTSEILGEVARGLEALPHPKD